MTVLSSSVVLDVLAGALLGETAFDAMNKRAKSQMLSWLLLYELQSAAGCRDITGYHVKANRVPVYQVHLALPLRVRRRRCVWPRRRYLAEKRRSGKRRLSASNATPYEYISPARATPSPAHPLNIKQILRP